MSLRPPDDIDILDLDDLERGGPRMRRQPRQAPITPGARQPGSWADPRFLIPLVLLLTAVFVIGMAIRSDGTQEESPGEEIAAVATSELAVEVQEAELRAGFSEIEITEEDGTIIITGKVRDALEAGAIGAVARSVEGTQRVDNRVVIADGVLAQGSSSTLTSANAGGGGLAQQLAEFGQVTFETGSASLTPDGSAVVDSVAALLNRSVGIRVEVHGHTDSDGDETRNQVLSQERAQAVVVALAQRGVDTARLTAIGFGESNPIQPNITSEGRAVNRRIEFVVSI
ncbi:MAG: outer membrane protein OmpA-like peptidoglycan-associated protein [Verrucomicrobiales bacterium]|jgi:outer membrane protein OmpA-like peptidoglycan-associated protein